MTTVIGVMTYDFEEGWSKFHANVAGAHADKIQGGGFRIGEGGWVNVPPKVPKSPSPSLSDLDAAENPLTYPADSRFVFPSVGVKAFNSITHVAPNIVRLECLVDFGEANDDGFGNDPEFWELGVFDSGGYMVAYFTFPVDSKNALKQLLYEVDLVFAGA